MPTPHRRTDAQPVAARRVTITEVAHAAGVSIAVVSYALNGRPGVSDSTRRHVLRVAEDLGWRPNAAARSLRSAAAAGVGLQLLARSGAALGSPSGVALAAGLRTVARDLALAVDVAVDRETGAQDLETFWTERRRAAFVLTDLLLDDPRTGTAARIQAPVVAVTPPGLTAAEAVRSVWFAGRATARAGGYLADLGHRRVALVVSEARSDTARDLQRGIDESMPGTQSTVVEAPTPAEAGAATSRLLSAERRPTAIVTDGDITALAVLDAARRRGTAVPWELSVVSGADGDPCRLVQPQLTAIARSWEDLAPVLRDVLSAATAGGSPSTGARRATPQDAGVTVPHERLVIRGSTAPPPDGA